MAFQKSGASALVVLLAISAVDCAAHSMNSLGPFAVSELVRSGRLSLMQAGIWSSTEMLAYAAAMAGLAPFSPRLRFRPLALFAANCVIVAQAGSAFVHGFPLLLALRMLSGIGLGTLNAVVNIAASRLKKPVFALSFVMVIQTFVFSAASLLLPHAGDMAGQKGVFLVLAALVMLLLPLMTQLPKTGNTPPSDHPSAVGRTGSGTALWALLAVLFYTGGSLAMWPFTERIGAAIGLKSTTFGLLSALANVGGLFACFVTTALSRRGKPSRFLVPAILAIGVICLFQGSPPGRGVFCAAFILNYAGWFYIYPNLIGLTCLVDPSGRLATRSGGVWMLSQAGATLFASISGQNGTYLWVGIFSLCFCLLAAWFTRKVQSERFQIWPSSPGRTETAG